MSFHGQDGTAPGVHAAQTASAALDIRLIVLRHAHHAGASGYDRLADYLPARRINPLRRRTLAQRAAGRLVRPLARRAALQWYHSDEVLAELRAAASWFRPGRRVYHFLYGENSYRYLGLLKRTGRRQPIVCTFHTPAERFGEVVRSRAHLSGLDACVALTTEMRDFFADLLGPERAVHIPHGVDTAHYRPAPMPSGYRLEALAVGSHLRDFDALYEAARILAQRAPALRLTVVAGKERLASFARLPNVDLRHKVPDPELLGLYQRASVFLLPLRGVTANNALLEAIACGCPVVASDLPGVRDHIGPDCARLIAPASGEAMAEAVLDLLDDEPARQAMGTAARTRALALDWTRIAARMVRLYRTVAER